MNRAIPELPRGIWAAMRALAPDADRFVSLVRHHRLLPVAANDPSLEVELRAPARDVWEKVRAANDEQSRALDEEIDELMALLAAEECIFVKGAAFRRTIWPDRTLRPMFDIDIVVRNHRSVVRRLEEAGYAATRGYFIKPPRNLLVETIPRFTQETRHAVDHDEIFRERIAGVAGARHLADHHALATHALLVGTTIHVQARKLLDLWLLSRDPDVVDHAVETAARWKMRRVFHAAMCLLARAFPDSGGDWRKEKSSRTLTRSERRFVEHFVLPRLPLGPEALRPLQLARRLALLDSNAIRAKFVTSSLLRRRLSEH